MLKPSFLHGPSYLTEKSFLIILCPCELWLYMDFLFVLWYCLSLPLTLYLYCRFMYKRSLYRHCPCLLTDCFCNNMFKPTLYFWFRIVLDIYNVYIVFPKLGGSINYYYYKSILRGWACMWGARSPSWTQSQLLRKEKALIFARGRIGEAADRFAGNLCLGNSCFFLFLFFISKPELVWATGCRWMLIMTRIMDLRKSCSNHRSSVLECS